MKIIIYGAGDFGTMLCSQIMQEQNHMRGGSNTIVAVVDSNPQVQGLVLFEKYTVLAPESILELEYDQILVSASEEQAKFFITHKLAQMGVTFDKIKFGKPTFQLTSDSYRDDDPHPWRIETARNFNNLQIPGNVAECGVFRGTFAKRLNRLFYDRKLFLFDTFEGFSDESLMNENNRFYCGEFTNWVIARNKNGKNWHSDTSVDYVMSLMPFPKQVIIKKGLVPDTFAGVEDTFAFVSLDMDIYEPTFEALKFFWDKMSKGGMLLLHDYYYSWLPGIELAVKDFEQWLGAKVAKFAVRDVCSLAIIKN